MDLERGKISCISLSLTILCAVLLFQLCVFPTIRGEDTITAFYNDLSGFNEMTGYPPVMIDFDGIDPGTDITGQEIRYVTFEGPGAPLFVVRGEDTYTTSGFQQVKNASTNKLFPTSGENVLSPGNTSLPPGPNIPKEDDDLTITFEIPVSAIGLDILYQSLDGASYTAIEIRDTEGELLFEEDPLPMPGVPPEPAAPGGAFFVGFVSTTDNIASITFNDFDDDDYFPDCNIGYDTLRYFIPVLPAELYIDAEDDNITLNWTQPFDAVVSHYLLYRSTSQTGFDFSDVWINTSIHDDNGTISLRTTWNDTGAASETAPREYYYILRTVYDWGVVSCTSRTVGKYTRVFPSGVSTFSMPLEPLNKTIVDDLITKMNARCIRYMDSETRTWATHEWDDGPCVNNTLIDLGRGYEVEFENETRFTFTGMPGAMIQYNNASFGFDTSPDTGNADSLTASVNDEGNVQLTWIVPNNMGFYDSFLVFRSTTRCGFWGVEDVDYILVGTLNLSNPHGWASLMDSGVAESNTEYYYMVVPFNNSTGQRGNSSYSIGVFTAGYLGGYDTLAIPLKIESHHTTDWYCDNIPDTIGINFINISAQRWCWHSTTMPEGAFDPLIVLGEGYQISTSGATKYTFIGT